MLASIGRILAYIPLAITCLIGIMQVVIKAIKEIITAVIDLLFPLFPDGGKFETFVNKVREGFNKFSAWWDKAKEWLLKIAGAVGVQK